MESLLLLGFWISELKNNASLFVQWTLNVKTKLNYCGQF